MKNVIKLMSLFLATLLLMFSAIHGVSASTSSEEQGMTDELMPIMARQRCTYNHYEVSASWGNGNVKTITYWLVDSSGQRVGDQTWSKNYAETGSESMGAYGTPGGFSGCKCPMCSAT